MSSTLTLSAPGMRAGKFTVGEGDSVSDYVIRISRHPFGIGIAPTICAGFVPCVVVKSR